MTNLKKLFLIFSLLISGALIFAQNVDYDVNRKYVCLSSFISLENALKFQKELESKNLQTVMQEVIVDGKLFHRVLVDVTETGGSSRKIAELKKNKIIDDLPIEGELWPVNPSAENTKATIEASKIVEQQKLNKVQQVVVQAEPENEVQELIIESNPENEVQEVVIQEPEFSIQEEPIEVPIQLVENQPKPEIKENQIALEVNDKIDDVEEKPYSVLVKSYAEESSAERDCNRLVKQDIDAYVLKKFDQKELFKFDLHAGKFLTEEEAEPLQEKLQEMGIQNTKIENYNDFCDLINAYEEVISEKTVVAETGNLERPGAVPEFIEQSISQFPVNLDFEIESAVIVDLNIVGDDFEDIDELGEFDFCDVTDLVDVECAQALSMVEYIDDLFGNKVKVMVLSAKEDEAFEYLEDPVENTEFVQRKFALTSGEMDCYYSNDGDDFYLFGISQDKNLFIYLEAFDFTQDKFVEFLDNIKSDSSLLVMPQIRKNLYILPNTPDEYDFACFIMRKVGEEYAERRNYVDWSMAMVGHWNSEAIFKSPEEEYSIGFFDLDYDFNAKTVHTMFMTEKEKYDITSNNKPVDVNGQNGWYLKNYDDQELSFAHKSYIIAVDYEYNSDKNVDDLLEKSLDLQIWE